MRENPYVTRFKKGHLYHIVFKDHNESDSATEPKALLNVVGRYVGQKDSYLILCNWWSEDMDESVQTRCNVLKKAIVDSQELRHVKT